MNGATWAFGPPYRVNARMGLAVAHTGFAKHSFCAIVGPKPNYRPCAVSVQGMHQLTRAGLSQKAVFCK